MCSTRRFHAVYAFVESQGYPDRSLRVICCLSCDSTGFIHIRASKVEGHKGSQVGMKTSHGGTKGEQTVAKRVPRGYLGVREDLDGGSERAREGPNVVAQSETKYKALKGERRATYFKS